MNQGLGIAADILSLPSGGPELHGLGEKFEPTLLSGTGNFSVPLRVPGAPAGFGPDVVLRYTTGGAAGPFGLGWDVPILRITRSTLKGVPRYDLASGEHDESFTLGGGDELVPVGGDLYRPRTESQFWKVRRTASGWSIITKDGTQYILGQTSESCLLDDSTGHVFGWYLSRIVDPHGNEIIYTYRRDENYVYVKRIKWGPFALEFEYSDRPDQVTSFRTGFPVDLRLRCTEIRLESTNSGVQALRRYRLGYENPEPAGHTLLASVSLEGDSRDGTVTLAPELRLEYSKFDLGGRELHTFDTSSGGPPPDLSQPQVSFVDLSGDGLPDVVDTDPDRPLYWRNLGGCRWAPPKSLPPFAGGLSIADPAVMFADMEGNGTADVLVASSIAAGYYPNSGDRTWEQFVSYRSRPAFDPDDPHFRLYDVNGDGRIDAIYTGADRFILFENLGRDGWSDQLNIVSRVHDLDSWPDVSFGDKGVFIADMNGDGLTDIGLLQAGEVSYWPYAGHGRWGKRVKMSGDPVRLPENYEASHLFFVDLNGDGLTDILYVDSDRVLIWINQSGQSIVALPEISPIPRVVAGSVTVADMRGTGCTGIVFTYPGSVTGGEQYRYLTLAGERPSGALVSIDNGMGGITTIGYTSATEHRLKDVAAGTRWKSFLPFPLQVVSFVEVQDAAAGILARTEYRYHDGHYDGDDREFRGFGRVEEIQFGDASGPTIIRESLFHLGCDMEKTEAERRREISTAERERQRALRGSLLQFTSTSVNVDRSDSRPIITEKIVNTWGIREEYSGSRGVVLFPHLMSTRVTKPGLGAADLVSVIRYLRYDFFGNLVERDAFVGSASEVDVRPEDYRRDVTEYAHDSEAMDAWMVGIPVRSAVYDSDGMIRAATYYYYDGQDFIGLELGKVTCGALTRQEELAQHELDSSPTLLTDADMAALGYYRAGDQSRGDAGWYRNALRYARNRNGSIRGIRDPLGNETTIFYDAENLRPVRVTDAAGLVTESEYDPAADAIRVLRQPSGLTEKRDYDGLGRTQRAYRGSELSLQLKWMVSYDEIDVQPDLIRPASITTLLARRVDQTADELEALFAAPHRAEGRAFAQRMYLSGTGRELRNLATAEVDLDGAAQVFRTGARAFDVRGRLAAEGRPEFAGDYDYDPRSDDHIEAYRFSYDHLGRVVASSRPDGARREAAYTPWQIALRSERDTAARRPATHIESFDAKGALIKVQESLSPEQLLTTRYRYTSDGEIASITDNRGREIISNVYDRLGRKLFVRHVDAGDRKYVYDAAGNLIEGVDPTGARLGYRYDVLHRLIEISTLDATGRNVLRRYRYDDDPDRPDIEFTRGRLTRVDDVSGTTQYEYDIEGRVTSTIRTLPDRRVLRVDRGYDFVGNLVSIKYPDGGTVDYEYNESNLLVRIPGYVENISYDVEGRRKRVEFANGVETRFSYLLGLPWVQQIITSAISRDGAPGTLIQSIIYEYDVIGNITKILDEGPDGSRERNFQYDDLQRLVRVRTQLGSEEEVSSYSYDDAGNFIINGDVGAGRFEYNNPSRPNLLTRFSVTNENDPVEIEYDAAGRVTSQGRLTSLTYDEFSRLVRVALEDGAVVQYTYDHLGMKVTKSVERDGNTADTIFFDNIYEESASGSRTRRVFAPFGLVAEVNVAPQSSSESVNFHHADHSRSTMAVTDANGSLLIRQSYSAFGKALSTAGLHRYVGQDFDVDTGLYQYGARYYDPRIGRFITPDLLIIERPERFIATPQSLNLYSYALNNPLRYADPQGGFVWIILAGFLIGAALGAAAAYENGARGWDVVLGAVIGGAIGAAAGGAGVLGSAVLGAGLGAASAAISHDEKIFSAAAIGFAFGALGGWAGQVIKPVSGEGLLVNLANFSIEVATDATISGLAGGVSSTIHGEDFGKGFTSGFIIGAQFSAGRQLVFGIRYDPASKVAKDDIRKQWDLQQPKDIVTSGGSTAGRSYVSQPVAARGMPDPASATFRRGGLASAILGRSFTVGSVNTHGSDAFDASTLAHELRHVAQQRVMTFGVIELAVVGIWTHATQSEVVYKDLPTNRTIEPPY